MILSTDPGLLEVAVLAELTLMVREARVPGIIQSFPEVTHIGYMTLNDHVLRSEESC